MNIFVLDSNHSKSVTYLCDKHVRKMTLETAQLLCNAHRMLDGFEGCLQKRGNNQWVENYRFVHPTDIPDETRFKQGPMYLMSHPFHPCTVWTIQNSSNYEWLLLYFEAILAEFEYRFGKPHKSVELLPLLKNFPLNIRNGTLLDNVHCMPDEFKTDNTVEAYRSYYRSKQVLMQFSYTNRKPPEWLS